MSKRANRRLTVGFGLTDSSKAFDAQDDAVEKNKDGKNNDVANCALREPVPTRFRKRTWKGSDGFLKESANTGAPAGHAARARTTRPYLPGREQ